MTGNDREGFMFTRHGGFHLFGDDAPVIEDIAHALGMQCRYNGSVKEFYSVAQHCVKVSKLLRRQGFDLDTQLAGLLHDAGEAYVGDITRPVQTVLDMAEFKALEARILLQVHAAAALETCIDMNIAVHAADDVMCDIEIRDLIHNDHGLIDYDGLPDVRIGHAMLPQDATELWLYTYRTLQDARQEGMCVR